MRWSTRTTACFLNINVVLKPRPVLSVGCHNAIGRTLRSCSRHPYLPESVQITWRTAATSTKNSSRILSHSQLIARTAREGLHHQDALVTIGGLVRSVRRQKRVVFVHISDGSTLEPIQAVVEPSKAVDITTGSYVELKGTWSRSQGKGQNHELIVSELTSLGRTDLDEYPIQKKALSTELLRASPHLRLRTPLYSLLARARSELTQSLHSYFGSREEVTGVPAFYVHPPLITSSDCEGAGEVFTILPRADTNVQQANNGARDQQHYFKDQKYLTVSGQLHLEAYAAELRDVWTLSPTFRAEASDTPRHLSEFYMLEAEFRSICNLDALLSQVEEMIRHLVESFEKSRSGLELLEYYGDHKFQSNTDEDPRLRRRYDSIGGEQWPRVTYTQAMNHLAEAYVANPTTFSFQPSWHSGLQLEHERWLVTHLGHDRPLFVTHYPKSVKPFYMLPSSESEDFDVASHGAGEGETVACFDLLFPHGTCEVAGGSLREHRLPHLIQSMQEHGMVKENQHTTTGRSYPYLKSGESLGPMQWYADLRRFGSSPHGGYGLGFDRLLGYLTGVGSIRDTVGFPRYFGRADT